MKEISELSTLSNEDLYFKVCMLCGKPPKFTDLASKMVLSETDRKRLLAIGGIMLSAQEKDNMFKRYLQRSSDWYLYDLLRLKVESTSIKDFCKKTEIPFLIVMCIYLRIMLPLYWRERLYDVYFKFSKAKLPEIEE